jgi:hypothetical protein
MKEIRLFWTERGIEVRSYFAGRKIGGVIRADYETASRFGSDIECELVRAATDALDRLIA